MFKVKRKNNPAITYTVLWVLYELGRAMFLIYDTEGFVLRPASEFVLVENPEGFIDMEPLKDLVPSEEGNNAD